MKRRAKNKEGHNARRLRHREGVGFLDSPLVKGLVALIPLALLILVGSVEISLRGSEVERALLEVGSFPHSTLAHWRLAGVAADGGDYNLAENEYVLGLEINEESSVLGVNTELENRIWPERQMEEELRDLLSEAEERPSRLVYLRMAKIYWQIRNGALAKEMLGRAVAIDPNDTELNEIESLLID